MGNTVVKPPKELQADGRALWGELQAEFEITNSAGFAILRTIAECRDLEREAMRQAQADGLSTLDRYGQRRPHPLLSVARDARGQLLAALRQLRLEKKVTLEPWGG